MVEYKYNIIKEILNKNKIPEDIQEIIIDKLVPEHQKINLIDEFKKERPWDENSEEYIAFNNDRPLSTRFNRPCGWRTYFKDVVNHTYIKKVNFNCFNPAHYQYLEFDDDERYILNSCYDEDIYDYFGDFFSPEDFNNWVVDGILEKKKFYEINARDRYSFYKLHQDPCFKHFYSNNMIFTIDAYYENKKNIFKKNFEII